MATTEYNQREDHIRFIRSKLPKATDRELSVICSFVRALNICGWSSAECHRPVLSAEMQERADIADMCINSIRDALKDGEYSFDVNSGEVLLGVIAGDTAILDAAEVVQIYKDAGWRHVKREIMFQGLEECGFILPRSSRPKTAVINGKRREVLYVPYQKIQEAQA